MNKRSVFCEDAIQWLETREVQLDSSLVSSMPDISEFPGYSLNDWKNWFVNTASLILSKTAPEGVTIFYQSDIKFEGTWVDKGYLCQKAAEDLGHELLWHKIICRSPAGIATFGRPAYSHMLCFSKKLKVDISKSTPDVIPDLGDKTWQRGMGLEACLMAAKFIVEQTPSKTVINPFCGEGSMLAAASVYELEGIGIERSPKRAEKARRLELKKEKSGWVFNE
jgi:hypothetical protein